MRREGQSLERSGWRDTYCADWGFGSSLTLKIKISDQLSGGGAHNRKTKPIRVKGVLQCFISPPLIRHNYSVWQITTDSMWPRHSNSRLKPFPLGKTHPVCKRTDCALFSSNLFKGFHWSVLRQALRRQILAIGSLYFFTGRVLAERFNRPTMKF